MRAHVFGIRIKSAKKGMEERAKETARTLWNETPERVVDSATAKEIDRVVTHATKALSA